MIFFPLNVWAQTWVRIPHRSALCRAHYGDGDEVTVSPSVALAAFEARGYQVGPSTQRPSPSPQEVQRDRAAGGRRPAAAVRQGGECSEPALVYAEPEVSGALSHAPQTHLIPTLPRITFAHSGDFQQQKRLKGSTHTSGLRSSRL